LACGPGELTSQTLLNQAEDYNIEIGQFQGQLKKIFYKGTIRNPLGKIVTVSGFTNMAWKLKCRQLV